MTRDMKPRSGVRPDWSYCHSYLKNLRPKPLPMWLDLRMQRMFICTAAAFCMMCHMLTMMWKFYQIDCCHMTAQSGFHLDPSVGIIVILGRGRARSMS